MYGQCAVELELQKSCLASCLNSVLNVKALVGAYSVIVKTGCETD